MAMERGGWEPTAIIFGPDAFRCNSIQGHPKVRARAREELMQQIERSFE
jgi:hypothetical protein